MMNWSGPLARRDETAFNRHYGHPAYWVRPGPWAGATSPAELARTVRDVGNTDTGDRDVFRLRSTGEIAGYRVVTSERAIGHVCDFAFDDDTWVIKYLVVDSGTVAEQQRVLIAPEWADTISWHYSTIHLNLVSETIEPDLGGSTEPSPRLLDLAGRGRRARAQAAGSRGDPRPARLLAIRWHQENGR